MSSLTILCGIPGCGKSTWAKTFLSNKEIFSSDEIRATLGDVNDQSQNNLVFSIFHAFIATSLGFGKDVVADSTALDARARRKLRAVAEAVAENQGSSVHLVYFSNCDQAVRRNLQRERVVPDEAMRRMLDKYELFRVVLPNEASLYETITEIRSFE